MRILLMLGILVSTAVFSQSEILAKDYFKKGDYTKALHEYKKLYAKSPSNFSYINQVVMSHQQLEQYNEAEMFLNKIISRMNYPALLVELGYNYQLKGDIENATLNYNKAIASITIRPSNVFAVGRSFQSHTLLDEAVISYKKAMELNPNFDFKVQLAKLYGELGDVEKMFDSYVSFAESNPTALGNVKRELNGFISENSETENNILFRRTLLKRIQQAPNIILNELLSWLFIQQKDYRKAFVQEKAIFNRKPESLNGIEELALIASSENENEVAREIFTYLTETAQDLQMIIDAHYHLLQIETKESTKADYEAIKSKYLAVFDTYGEFSQTLNIQVAYAHFLAFNKNEIEAATSRLETALKLPLTRLQKAEVKLELGDILILQEQFNKALIYYTQIQRNLKNSTISQEARYRVAKTSYYKGDFKWAESQLKILKSSTSQLTANDALDLKLFIADNKYEDSLQTALKLYAKADLLAFQNKKNDALQVLNKILENHKTEPIIAQTLYKQAQLFINTSKIPEAASNFETIINDHNESILIDDAYFNLGRLYETVLNSPEKAKKMYEHIVFNHADSIYFVEARKRYRALRGEAIN